MPDRAISVPQATQIAQATKRQLTELNGRLDQLSLEVVVNVDENGNATIEGGTLENVSEVSF